MRLEKLLAYSGIASRRKSKEIILAGAVKVNDEVCLEPGFRVGKTDVVTYQGDVVEKVEHVYYLMNKPRGIVTTTLDEKNRKTVIDLLSVEDQEERVYPIGRLDYDTAGLLLLTNDGVLTQHLTRPEYDVDKTYLARVFGLISKDALRRLERGVKLEGYTSKPATVVLKERNHKQKTSLIEITISEGKNHQIKNMCHEVGFPVKSLTRIRFDFLTLEGVKRGEYRPLKVHEIKKLYAHVKK